MSKAKRWPLLIDPQGQANKFVRRLGAAKFAEGMDVIKLTDKNMMRSMENAVRFGKWVLLENVLEVCAARQCARVHARLIDAFSAHRNSIQRWSRCLLSRLSC